MSTHHLQSMALEIHAANKSKGFWDSNRKFPEVIALIHSELSEALEADRQGDPDFYIDLNTGKPEGAATELADAVIRVLDYVGRVDLPGMYGLSFDEIIQIKLNYNAQRPAKHGKGY